MMKGSGRSRRGGDARQRAPLVDRLARVIDPAGLERSQPAVRGALMVEGRGRGEVARLDERDLQPARGGVERRRQSVNAAADDEHVEGRAAERCEVAVGRIGQLSYSRPS
jgi:hypothetical protein